MSIITESLLEEIKNIEALVTESSRATLKTVLTESIDKMLKEAIEDEDTEEKEDNTEEELGGEENTETEKSEENSEEENENPATETDTTDLDNIISGGDEEETELEVPSLEIGSEEAPEEDSIIDLTGKDYSEFLTVFQKMKADDNIVFDDNELTIKDADSGNEYLIKEPTEMNNTTQAPVEGQVEENKSLMDEELEGDVLVISTNLPYTEEGEAPIEENMMHTVQNSHRQQIKPDNFPQELTEAKAKLKEYETKYNALKEGYVKLENDCKNIVNECKGIVLFNQKLGYATSLMMENATSKEEKMMILNKVNEAKSFDELKVISESLKKDLKTKVIKETKTIKEKPLAETKQHTKTMLMSEETKKFLERNKELYGHKYGQK